MNNRIQIRPVLRVLAAMAWFIAATCRAHDPGLSTALVTVRADSIQAVFIFSEADAKVLLHAEEVSSEQSLKQVTAAAEKGIVLSLGEKPIRSIKAITTVDEAKNVSVNLEYSVKPAGTLTVQSGWLKQLPSGHRQFLTFQSPSGVALREQLLDVENDSASLECLPPESPAPAPEAMAGTRQSFAGFLAMGAKHIWTGYDHLLFLFGLLVVTRNFKESFKIITCFTIAHSVTLAIATLNLVNFSSRLVEPLIAASIVFVGAENLWKKGEPNARWILTFAFGLIHGFGFASVLRELGVGENGSGIAVPLLSFNLGVELGQLAVASLALPVLWWLREKPKFARAWIPATSAVVALLGAYWFVERVWF